MRMTRLAAPLLFGVLLHGAARSLVPETPGAAPDYFCTWNVQGYVTSYANSNLQADAMTERNLFGKGRLQNWAEFYTGIRRDLYFVLDDTWDIPIAGGRSHPMRGSMEMDGERFPSYTGTPEERLAKLNRELRARGWRGAGLWICSARARARRDPAVNDEAYWADRLRWSREAGVDYWKVDWGAMSRIDVWRLNQWAHWYAPNVWIEHGDLDRSNGRMWLPDKIDVFRTYDVNIRVAIPETIRRIAQVLRFPREDHTSRGLINCEDEVYIGAALGCAYGVMRHPFAGDWPNGQPDRVFPADFRDLKRRLDEVTRAVRWHRIAQPFGRGRQEAVDSEEFRDSPQSAGAPARVARGGLPLPKVSVPAGEARPFVLCSRYPNGAIAVATAGRTTAGKVVLPRADVTIEVGRLSGFVGVFGEYDSLTLVTDRKLTGKRILAQDLAGAEPVDITREVTTDGGRLTVPGAVIHRVGLMAAQPGDRSDPGLVIAVTGVPERPPFRTTPGRAPAGRRGGGRADADLRIARAVWGPVFGGRDVTPRIAAMVHDGTVTVDALPAALGDFGADRNLRLEVEYTCRGKRVTALAVFGERLTIDGQGHYTTSRAPAKP